MKIIKLLKGITYIDTRTENIMYGILCAATMAVIITMIILDLSRQ
jgi:hypothetical protein